MGSVASVSRSGLWWTAACSPTTVSTGWTTLWYIAGNVVPCCKICNNAKKDLPLEEFMAWIARLTEYHWFHPDVMLSHLLART